MPRINQNFNTPQLPTNNSNQNANTQNALPLSNLHGVIRAPFSAPVSQATPGQISASVSIDAALLASQIASHQGVTPASAQAILTKKPSSSAFFWNGLDVEKAAKLLTGMPVGTWLLRSSSQSGHLVVSCVSSTGLLHARIKDDPKELQSLFDLNKNFVTRNADDFQGMPAGTWSIRESSQAGMFTICILSQNGQVSNMRIPNDYQSFVEIKLCYDLENHKNIASVKALSAAQPVPLLPTPQPSLDSHSQNYGAIGSQKAAEYLLNKPEMTWLLRKSKQANKAAISYIRNNKIYHILIDDNAEALEKAKESLGRNLKDVEADKMRAKAGKYRVGTNSYLPKLKKIAPQILSLPTHPANFGTLNGEETTKLLQDKPVKTWLLRYSDSRKSYYLSYREADSITNVAVKDIDHFNQLIKDLGLGKNIQELINENARVKFKRAIRRLNHLHKKGLKSMVDLYHPEFIDMQHRYGRQINDFFETWKNTTAKESFIDWMAIFDQGKVGSLGINDTQLANLKKYLTADNKPNLEKVTYLNYNERKAYEIKIENGKVRTDREGILNTPASTPRNPQSHIFVIAGNGKIYSGLYVRGTFNHSSFLSGAPVQSAGELIFSDGIITAITDKSGHYESSPEMVQEGVKALHNKGVDLTNAKVILNSHPLSTMPKVEINALDFIKQDLKATVAAPQA